MGRRAGDAAVPRGPVTLAILTTTCIAARWHFLKWSLSIFEAVPTHHGWPTMGDSSSRLIERETWPPLRRAPRNVGGRVSLRRAGVRGDRLLCSAPALGKRTVRQPRDRERSSPICPASSGRGGGRPRRPRVVGPCGSVSVSVRTCMQMWCVCTRVWVRVRAVQSVPREGSSRRPRWPGLPFFLLPACLTATLLLLSVFRALSMGEKEGKDFLSRTGWWGELNLLAKIRWGDYHWISMKGKSLSDWLRSCPRSRILFPVSLAQTFVNLMHFFYV